MYFPYYVNFYLPIKLLCNFIAIFPFALTCEKSDSAFLLTLPFEVAKKICNSSQTAAGRILRELPMI